LLQRGHIDLGDGILAKLMSSAKVVLMCRVRGGCLIDKCRGSPALTADRSASGLSTFRTRLDSDRCGIGIALRLALAVFAITSSRTNAVLDSMLGKSPIARLFRACFLVGCRDSFECLHSISNSATEDLSEVPTAFMDRLWRTLFCQPLLPDSWAFEL